MDLAALLALRQPTEIALGEHVLVVPVRSLRDWLASLSEPVPALPLLDHADAVWLNGLRWDPDSGIDDEVLAELWQEALTAQSGYPWYVAERLLTLVRHSWHQVAGELALRGIDLLTAPLDVALAATLAAITRNSAEKDRRDFEMKLWAAPPSDGKAEPAQRWTAEEEGAMWLAAAQSAATSAALGARKQAVDALP